MRRASLLGALALLLVVSLVACGDTAPAPPKPAAPVARPQLPPGCVWVPMQGQGKDSSDNTWVFSWWQPVCGAPTPAAAPGGAYNPPLAAAAQMQAIDTWLIIRAASYGGAHYSGGEDGGGEGGHAGGGEDGGGGHGGGGSGGE